MKNFMDCKSLLVLLLIALSAPNPAQGQTAYQGGSGDGYDSAGWPANPTSVEKETEQALRFTNPVKGVLPLHIYPGTESSNIKQYSIRDVSGRKKMQGTLRARGKRLTIHVQNLKAGTYVVKLYTKKQVMRFRFIKI